MFGFNVYTTKFLVECSPKLADVLKWNEQEVETQMPVLPVFESICKHLGNIRRILDVVGVKTPKEFLPFVRQQVLVVVPIPTHEASVDNMAFRLRSLSVN